MICPCPNCGSEKGSYVTYQYKSGFKLVRRWKCLCGTSFTTEEVERHIVSDRTSLKEKQDVNAVVR